MRSVVFLLSLAYFGASIYAGLMIRHRWRAFLLATPRIRTAGQLADLRVRVRIDMKLAPWLSLIGLLALLSITWASLLYRIPEAAFFAWVGSFAFPAIVLPSEVRARRLSVHPQLRQRYRRLCRDWVWRLSIPAHADEPQTVSGTLGLTHAEPNGQLTLASAAYEAHRGRAEGSSDEGF